MNEPMRYDNLSNVSHFLFNYYLVSPYMCKNVTILLFIYNWMLFTLLVVWLQAYILLLFFLY